MEEGQARETRRGGVWQKTASSPQTLTQPTVKEGTSTSLYLPEVFSIYQYFLGNTSTILHDSSLTRVLADLK
jgi:hypothetical protein